MLNKGKKNRERGWEEGKTMKKMSNVGRENGQGCSKYKDPEVGRNLFFSPCACVEPLINPRMLLKLLAHRAKDLLIPAAKHTMFV